MGAWLSIDGVRMMSVSLSLVDWILSYGRVVIVNDGSKNGLRMEVLAQPYQEKHAHQ